MWGLPQKQNARRADKIRLCGHLRRYKKIVKKTYIICVKNYIKNNILKIENVILLDNDDISTGNSPGKNALIYLDVFSKDSTIKFYMVDQPGDDVSQNKI